MLKHKTTGNLCFRIVTFFFLLVVSLPIDAQRVSKIKSESSWKTKGAIESRIQIGLNMSRNSGLANDEFGIGLGLTGSAGIGYYFTEYLQLRTEMILLNRRSNVNFNGITTTYLDRNLVVPIIFEVQINKLSVFIGRHLNYLYKSFYYDANSDKVDRTGQLAKVSYGLDIGCGYDLYQGDYKVRIQGNMIAGGSLITGNLGLVLLK